jgi:hypothetical protein
MSASQKQHRGEFALGIRFSPKFSNPWIGPGGVLCIRSHTSKPARTCWWIVSGSRGQDARGSARLPKHPDTLQNEKVFTWSPRERQASGTLPAGLSPVRSSRIPASISEKRCGRNDVCNADGPGIKNASIAREKGWSSVTDGSSQESRRLARSPVVTASGRVV